MKNATPDPEALNAFFVHRSAASDHGLTRGLVRRNGQDGASPRSVALGIVVPVALTVGFSALTKAFKVAADFAGKARIVDLEGTLTFEGIYGDDGTLTIDGGFFVFHVGGGAYDERSRSFAEPPAVLGIFEVAVSDDGTAFRLVARRWSYREFLQPPQLDWKCKKLHNRDVALSIELECPGGKGFRTSFDRLFGAVSEEELPGLFGEGEESQWLPVPPRPVCLPNPREVRTRRSWGEVPLRGITGEQALESRREMPPRDWTPTEGVLRASPQTRDTENESRQEIDEVASREIEVEMTGNEEAVEASVTGFPGMQGVRNTENEFSSDAHRIQPDQFRSSGEVGHETAPQPSRANPWETNESVHEKLSDEVGKNTQEQASPQCFVPSNIRIILIESTKPYVLAKLLEESANATEKIALPLTNLVKTKITRK